MTQLTPTCGAHRRTVDRSPATMRSRLRLSTTVLLVLLFPAASAQAQSDDEPQVRMTVAAMNGVLGPGSIPPIDVTDTDAPDVGPAPADLQLRLLVENAGTQDLDQLRVVIEFFAAATTRENLHAALDGQPVGQALRVFDRPLRDGANIPPHDVVGHRERLTPEDLPWADDGGVHPIRISVVRGTAVLTNIVTAGIWLAQADNDPLRLVFAWPIDHAPTGGVGSIYPANSDRQWQPGGRIDAALRALERIEAPGVVMAPAPHLLEELRDRSDGFIGSERRGLEIELAAVEPEDDAARLANNTLRRLRDRTNAARFAPITTNYARADVSSLLRAENSELSALASLAAADAAPRVAALLDTEPDAATHLLDGPIDPQALDLLPASRLLVPVNAIDPAIGPSEPPIRALHTPAGRTMTALLADPFVSGVVSQPDVRHGAAVATQQVLASLAIAKLESVGAAVSPRTIVVIPRADWQPDVQVTADILRILDGAPWLEFTSPSAVATATPRAQIPVPLVAPVDVLSDELLDALSRANRRLSAARTALPPEVATIGGHVPEELHDALLRATSSLLHGAGENHARELVRSVARATDEAFGDISVTETRVTLTSDTGQIPVTLERIGTAPITVRVEVASPGRLTWPDGRHSTPIVLPVNGRQTVSFSTAALSTGTFPVTVRVTDPSGAYELTSSTIAVRSTALSGPALAMIGAAVILLLVAGVWRARRRQPVLTVVDRNSANAAARGPSRPSQRRK